jgi:hypothetical protein
MTMKNTVKVWLRKNELTPEPNDMTAIVSSTGSVNKQGIIDAIMEDGTEWKRETIEGVVDRYHRKIVQLLSESKDVNDGLVYLRLIVTGNFTGKKYDPAVNGIYVTASQGAMLRSMAANLGVETLGEIPDALHIYAVRNMLTREADGTLSRGRNAEVEGSYVKLAGDDPAVGVYLENSDSGLSIRLDDSYIVTNNPAKLILLIPADMPLGPYRLRIVTQYTSHKLLKAPRSTAYEQPLNVI